MKKKPTPAVKVSGTMFVYFSDRAVVCPLCGVTVPKATEHCCERKDA